MIVAGMVETQVQISDYNSKYCDPRCQHLNGMKDKCGLCGRLEYVHGLKLFVRGDKCANNFNTGDDNNGK